MLQVAFHTSIPVLTRHRSNSNTFRVRSTPRCNLSRKGAEKTENDHYDAVVIGSGLGGLCTAALLATNNKRVFVAEAHTSVGGAAQSFTRRTRAGMFKFEAGPHLFSGLTQPSRNPFSHVLSATDVHIDVTAYDKWGVFIGDSFTSTKVRKSIPFLKSLLETEGGPNATKEMAMLIDIMRPLGELATLLPPALLRADDLWGTLRTLAPRLIRPDLLRLLPYVSQLSKPFAPLLDKYVKDEFTRNFVNLLCFLLAGVQAECIPIAEVAFMFREWVGDANAQGEDDYVLQHPVGGASQIADSLVDSIQKSSPSSTIRTKCRVSKVLVTDDGSRAIGVLLASGKHVYASHVVSNVSALDMPKLLPDQYGSVADAAKKRDMCDSFMHLNFAIELTESLRQTIRGGELLGNYVSVEDWGRGLDDPDNVVLISIPSTLDDDVCPAGYAVVHAYTPATEPFGPWEALEPGSTEYEEYKTERADVLWRAVKRVFGCDVSEIAELVMVGTPRTHSKFLNRERGSYGPKVDARKGMLGLPFPSSKGLPDGFICVGDGVFPGVGVPAVAGSAWLVSNGIVSVAEQEKLLHRLNI